MPTPIRRFVVSEESMRPTLLPGDRLLGLRTERLRIGDVVCFERRPDFWLVKRVAALSGELSPIDAETVPAAHMVVLSDARDRTLADSRSFGAVPVEGSYRAIFRYGPRGRVGRLRKLDIRRRARRVRGYDPASTNRRNDRGNPK